MPPSKYPTMTPSELMQLFDQFGTWTAVREHLGMSASGFNGLKRRMGCYGRNQSRGRKKPSVLDSSMEQIRDLASKGYTCPEIVDALNLPVKEEQVRRQLHRHNIPLVARRGAQLGPKNPAWIGGRIIDKSGYALLLQPDHPYANSGGYVREHRLVMEAHLGRYLEPGEVIHHVNGDKQDNRLENLELFSTNGQHLAHTLVGKIPNWTPEGRARTLEGARRPRRKRANKGFRC
jgi:hypothetical protein